MDFDINFDQLSIRDTTNGCSSATLSQVELDTLHAKAKRYLLIKLQRVTALNSSFAISITNFYKGPNNLPTIPPDLQLDFIFANFNELSKDNYAAHSLKDLNVCRAIWYYSLDRRHSFSSHFTLVRLNVISIALVWAGRLLHSSTINSLAKPEYDGFWFAFIQAWMESEHRPRDFAKRDAFIELWHKSRLDLARLGPARNKRTRAITKEMRNVINEVTFDNSDMVRQFVDGSIDHDVFTRKGALMAMSQVLRLPQPKIGKDGESQPTEDEEDIDLAVVPWNSSHIRALMADVDESVCNSASPSDGRISWIEADDVMALLRGVGVNDITEMFEKLDDHECKQEEDIEMT